MPHRTAGLALVLGTGWPKARDSKAGAQVQPSPALDTPHPAMAPPTSGHIHLSQGQLMTPTTVLPCSGSSHHLTHSPTQHKARFTDCKVR